MTGRYLFAEDGRTPVLCADLMEWAKGFETLDRSVASTELGDARVSTVFLGLDHSFGGPVPILFESMVFGGPLDGEQRRYATRFEAEAGHERLCEKVRSSLSDTGSPT